MAAQVPPLLLPWLTCETSLTQKLSHYSTNVDLQILQQSWRKPSWFDKYQLKQEPPLLFERCILISANEKPCWFARTIIPEVTFNENLAIFQRLNQESLGEVIFTEPTIERLQLSYYLITPAQLEFYWLNNNWIGNKKEFWTRFSQFSIKQKFSFSLIEILLPSLETIIIHEHEVA